ncbi:uncharacterized protein LOC119472050 [Cebus imitator]|uniref:uncharacterized protein LOC119472050 n=1 Tax=Cebus imitator TaxID=2715852 RepID=UPI00189841F5|nr:uncharacterized protein LOC119472050 [Cebus imitator]
MPRAAAAPLSSSRLESRAPHPLPAPPGLRQGIRQSVPVAPSPLFREPLVNRQQLQQQARGSSGETSRDSRQASTDPARYPAQDPETRGARLPKRPLTRSGSRGGLRGPRSQPPKPQPSAVAAPRWRSGKGGWVEDATPD